MFKVIHFYSKSCYNVADNLIRIMKLYYFYMLKEKDVVDDFFFLNFCSEMNGSFSQRNHTITLVLSLPFFFLSYDITIPVLFKIN